jgi:hypothetical protein
MTMSTDTANSLIVSALAVNGVLAVVNSAVSETVPPIRLGIGLVVAGVGLALVAQPWPGIAGGMATLLLISGIFVHGGVATKAIGALFSATPTPKQNGAS